MKNFTKMFLAACLFTGFAVSLNAQSVGINSTGDAPNSSAMLDVSSTNKGFLPPRMTTAQIIAIQNPANGLLVFNTDDDKLYLFVAVSNQWKEVQYGTGVINGQASYTIGSSSSCGNTIVNGSYSFGIALSVSHTIQIDATVTTPGQWSITTNTVNGYTFGGTGTFISTGIVQVTLNGTGTPVAMQTDNFTATASGSGGTCSFSIEVVSPCGTDITDNDGNTYNTVLIGSQCWMAENLKTTTYRNGTSIPIVTDATSWKNLTTHAYCWYDNNIAWKNIYGALYNGYVIMNQNGLCPSGWHVPTNEEWTALYDYVINQGITSNLVGMHLKSCRQENSALGGDCSTTEHPRWVASGNYGVDGYGSYGYGFMGFPGGQRIYYNNTYVFQDLGWVGKWYSSTEWYSGSGSLRTRILSYGNSGLTSDIDYNQDGYSVRCLKDN
jgi:uncharacterized protein (TIGR02145 family)